MRTVFASLGALALVVAAPLSAQETVNPVGIWEWEVDFQGQIVGGTFEISGEAGSYTGVANSDIGPADLTSIVTDGNLIMLTVDAQGQEVVMELVVEGDEFTGVGSMGYEEFVITGRRRVG